MKYFGHIMRKELSCLEKEIIQGTVPGGRGRGRPRINWMVIQLIILNSTTVIGHLKFDFESTAPGKTDPTYST